MPNTCSARVWRWFFSRGAETIECELVCDTGAHALHYELRIRRTHERGSTFTERFGDVSRAFERQCELEGVLVGEGWTLDRYESADRAEA